MEEIVRLSAVQLRRAMGARQLSPVEVLEAHLRQIDALDAHVNAMAATCHAEARLAAQAAERAILRGEPLGPLHGLPVGVKDIEEVAGLLTTFGSPLYRDHVPARDGTLARDLRRAGAVIVGKTNVPEMGGGAVTCNPVWGATGNPFDPALNAGGSSGGSAAALAAYMLPLCTASDTGGSARIPAAYCGIAGFRPSPGLIPLGRRGLGWSPISTAGAMGRTVEDIALQLSALAGFDAADPLSVETDPASFRALAPVDLSQLRVGWTEDFGVCAVDEGVRAAFRRKMAAVGHHFRACEPLDGGAFRLAEAHRCFDVIRAANYVARYRSLYETSPERLSANTRRNYELGAGLSMRDQVEAHASQTRMFRDFQPLFEDYDLILAPTTPVTPQPWSQGGVSEINGEPLDIYYRWLALTYVTTLLTNPVMTLPCGRDDAGMPLGVQVVGRFRGDRELVAACLSLEAAWAAHAETRRPEPDLARLRAATPSPGLRDGVTHPPLAGAPAAPGGPVGVAV